MKSARLLQRENYREDSVLVNSTFALNEFGNMLIINFLKQQLVLKGNLSNEDGNTTSLEKGFV